MNVSGPAISVRVRVYGDLRKYLVRNAPDARQMSLPEGATGADLLALLGIDPADEVTFGLNGTLAHRGETLRDGDDIVLFGPMEGG